MTKTTTKRATNTTSKASTRTTETQRRARRRSNPADVPTVDVSVDDQVDDQVDEGRRINPGNLYGDVPTVDVSVDDQVDDQVDEGRRRSTKVDDQVDESGAPPDYQPTHNLTEAGLISSIYRRYKAKDIADLIGEIGYYPNDAFRIVENFARRFLGESAALRATSASDLVYRLESLADGDETRLDDDGDKEQWQSIGKRLRASDDAPVNLTLRELKRFYAQERRRADRAEDLSAGRIVFQKGLARKAIEEINVLLTIERPSERKERLTIWLDRRGTSDVIMAILRPIRRQANYNKLVDAKRRIMTIYGLNK